MRSFSIPILMCLSLAACGSGLKGEYVGEQGSIYEKIVVKSEGKADLIVSNAVTITGTYTADGDKIAFNMPGVGNVLEFVRDGKGCLEDKVLGAGKYCKR